MIASAGPDHYRQTIATLLSTDEIDALVVMYIPEDASQRPVIFEAIVRHDAGRAAGGGDKPVLACLMVEEGGPCLYSSIMSRFRPMRFLKPPPVS